MKQSSTGYGSAMMRAMENLLPEDKRFFEDPYSEKFLSPFWKFWVILMRLYLFGFGNSKFAPRAGGKCQLFSRCGLSFQKIERCI